MAPNASGRALADVDADALSIPKAKELAIFLRAGHGDGARLVNCCQSVDRSVEGLTIEVSVSLPQRPANDIKPSETIVVGFTSDERLPPGVFSPRPDFPYAPHTNLQTAGSGGVYAFTTNPGTRSNSIGIRYASWSASFGGLKRRRTVRCTNRTSLWSLCYSVRIQT